MLPVLEMEFHSCGHLDAMAMSTSSSSPLDLVAQNCLTSIAALGEWVCNGGSTSYSAVSVLFFSRFPHTCTVLSKVHAIILRFTVTTISLT